MSEATVSAVNDKVVEDLYRRGAEAEAQGQDEKAVELFERCLEENPDHEPTLFRLAVIYDRRAEDARAIELYERLCSAQPVHINVLLNLAVLYEDNSHYSEAYRCLDTVLRTNPNHARARLYMKDVESARRMSPDDEAGGHGANSLEVPITEFELSVRSRNCLKKMNIRSLGDLLKTTEQELLSYKNFGETSLAEIKALLASKGMRLGQSLETGELPLTRRVPAPMPEDIPNEILAKSVSELELSVRARKALQRLNINTLGDLAQRSEEELLACKNFGQTSLSELKVQLEQNGLGFRKLEE